MTNIAFSQNQNWNSNFSYSSADWIEKIERSSQMNSLSDISKALFNNRAELMGQAAKTLIQNNFGHLLDQEYCECPCCGRKTKASSQKVKREVTIMVGTVVLYRPYFYCKNCRYGFYPLDEALGLTKHKIQPDVQRVEAWLATNSPYDEAAETFKRCTGMNISDHHIHSVTNEIAQDLGVIDVCPTKEEIQNQIDELSEGKFRRPILMIGIDGAHAPTRPEPSERKGPRGKGEWKEVKGFRMYLLDNQRIVHLISWHQIKTDKELADDILKIKESKLISEEKVRICVIGDGAPWIWNRIKEIYPDAKKVLDYFHCSEYIHELANVQFGKETQDAREWIEATITRLFLNRADEIIDEMNGLNPKSDTAKNQIEKTVRYLSARKDMINYGSLKRGGYHIGSGGIESSNKFISNVRLKRSGAWWYPTNANNILKLRCAKYNGTFDRIMEEKSMAISNDAPVDDPTQLSLIIDNC